jgi:prolipoprotein diacylglyceryltransferase
MAVFLGAPPAQLSTCGVPQQPQAPFFDRAAIGTGLGFALVRTGCFIAGCDYGLPTALPWAVRFPPGSLAALDHARRGFVPAGAPSLPVHPTQLYEALVGLVGAAASAVPLARGRRDGRAFATFLAIYAVGRFTIELLRGDQDRGHVLSLSTAQWVSVALVFGLAIKFLRWPRRFDEKILRDTRVDATAISAAAISTMPSTTQPRAI